VVKKRGPAPCSRCGTELVIDLWGVCAGCVALQRRLADSIGVNQRYRTGPGPMAAFLPGGKKWTGAMYQEHSR
jgi:hypothetical protein